MARGRRYYWKAEYPRGFAPAPVDAATAHALSARSPYSAVFLFPIDGALNRLPHDHSPVGNRDAAALVKVTASWAEPSCWS